MQLLVYVPKITPRIKYIFTLIFREILCCDFELTSIADDFAQSNSPKMSYQHQPLGDELFFKSSALLSQVGIVDQTLQFAQFGEQKVPFAVSNSALPFDPFAAAFYFVSRYEEYLPFNADAHGRFPAKESLLYQLQLLKTPVVDNWAMILKNILLKRFPLLTFGQRKFTFVPTVDIDRAFLLRSNGFFKNASRVLKAAVNFDSEKMNNIIRTAFGRNDPFDTFDDFSLLHEQFRVQPIFFFLLAKNGHQEFDNNISRDDASFRQLIAKIDQTATVGIHPSYASNADTNKISEEMRVLEQITQKRVSLSRQHFLKLHLPDTYLQLIKAGINHDYSMGYATEVGFRAGTCTPFFWYDLQLEKQSHLKVHPFMVMDVTLRQYLKHTPEEATQIIEELISNVKLVNGTFSSIWHNEAISNIGRWKNWRAVYQNMLSSSLVY